MMARILLAVFILLAASQPASAQPTDGTILVREAVVLPDDAPERAREAAGKVVLERIVYVSDGLEVEGYLARPKEPGDTDLPCVIFNRGGNRDFGRLTPVRAAYMLGRLAERDYVAAASNYRGNGEFGRAMYPGDRVCGECEQPVGGVGREEFGGAEVHDVLNLIPVLEQVPEADTTRMGLFGWSRGGMMTYRALRESDRFAAAIVGAGMADVAAGLEERPGMEHVYADLVPGWDDPETRAAAIVERSAVRWAGDLPEETPILILHGTGDWRVGPGQALTMAGALLEARRPFRLVMLEGGDHGLTEFVDEQNRLVDLWLDTYVRDGESWPSLEPHGR